MTRVSTILNNLSSRRPSATHFSPYPSRLGSTTCPPKNHSEPKKSLIFNIFSVFSEPSEPKEPKVA